MTYDEAHSALLRALYEWNNAGGSLDRVVASISDLIDVRLDERRTAQETAAEPPRPGCEEWWHLRQYGYAPGGYIITCFDCREKVWNCDKRAAICRPCAEKRHSSEIRLPSPSTGE